MRVITAACSALVLAAFVVGDPPAQVGPLDALDQVELRIFDRTNQQRIRQGLRPLDHDVNLAAAARRHSEDMLRRGFFDHVNPDKQTPANRVTLGRRQSIRLIGENLWARSGGYPASQLSSLPDEALASLMASPPHRVNMFRPAYTHLGVGVAVMGSEVRLTQVFAQIDAR